MKVLCLSLCLIVPLQTESPAESNFEFSPTRRSDLRKLQGALVKDELCLSHIARLAWKGQVVHQHAVASKQAGDKRVTPDTLFPIWSMTKPITSVAAMMLYERGRFQLDDPVAEVIPALATFKVRGKDGALEPLTQPITFRHLLTHSSGIYGYDGSFHEEGTWKEVIELENLEEVVTLLSTKPLHHQPGAAYTYGMSTAVLGRAIEVLADQPFAEFVEKEICQPLGMKDTRFHLTPEDRQRFQPLFVKTEVGFREGTAAEDELYYKPGSALALGGEGLVSTLEDYGKFCQMLTDGGGKILKQETLAMMLSDQLGDTPGFDGEKRGQVLGLGFWVLKEPHKEGKGRPEGLYGWGGYHTTHFWIDPENRLYGLFMARRYPFEESTQERFMSAVYGSSIKD